MAVSLAPITVLTSAPTSASTPAPASAPGDQRVTVLSANIHGGEHNFGTETNPDVQANPAPLAAVRTVINNRDVDIALLQEVCGNQFQALVDGAPEGWHWTFSKQAPTPRLTALGMTTSCPSDGWIGNVVGSRYALSAVDSYLLPRGVDEPDCLNTKRACAFDYPMVCANVGVTGLAAGDVRACSTHLMAGWVASSPGPEVRPDQTARIRYLTKQWIDAGKSVIVGGDFNTAPHGDPLDVIYDLASPGAPTSGAGNFQEIDQVSGGAAVRGGGFTHQEEDSTPWDRNPNDTVPYNPSATMKLDYIFFSKNRTAPLLNTPANAGLTAVVKNNYSDHEILVGTATIAN
ncbi:endonuclease/exonuclease/phosphatase family protein [Nocardioides lijunqiniae]|uniref:endonuclease/exonuclease/phosphatase family protein n=1 Tax=Nocardioides lijunqiniae TaxID=2760832 RepID=UPI001877F569|nr:endonuclease/exonuclease/phosphatase family protein [Nocardioides lijunqiniae]